MAKNAIKGWGQEGTPAVLLLAMITIISQQVNAAEAQNLVHCASSTSASCSYLEKSTYISFY
jgi:hypothetical protein